MNARSQKHFSYVKNLAASDPKLAFREADLMAQAESDKTEREAWMRLALEIQKESR